MPWIQIIDNAAVPAVFLVLVTVALAGQVLALRVISLSLVSAMIAGAYGAKVALVAFHTDSLAVAVVVGCASGCLMAWLGAWLDAVFRENSKMLALLASLGFLKILQGLITVVTGGGVEAFNVSVGQLCDSDSIFCSPTWLPYGLFLAGAAALAHWFFLKFTHLGAAAVAVGDDPGLASLFGIPVVRVQLLTQCAGGAVAGIGGVILALDSGLRPDLGFNLALKAFGILIIANGRYILIFPWLVGLVCLEQTVGYHWGGQLREASGLAFLATAIILAQALGWNRSRKRNADPKASGVFR